MRRNQILVFCLAAFLLPLFLACHREDPEVTFNVTSLEMPGEGGSMPVTLTCNYDWTAKTSDPWLQVSPTSGKKGTTVTLNIKAEANDKSNLRKGSVTVTLKDFSRSIAISQLPNLDQKLRIFHTNASFTVPSMTGSSLAGKVNWGDGVVETYKAGLTHDYASGAGSHTISINTAGAYSFKLESVAGVSEIDFQEF